MSGVSLAVAPWSDPADETSSISKQEKLSGVMGSVRVIELQLVAFIMVFSASGLVPLFDLAFPVFTTLYLLLLSRLAFPIHNHASHICSKENGGMLLRAYVILGTIIGLFFPLAYVLGAFARGDEHSLQSATPHLFLLSCQILTENIISGLSNLFSPPVRALVPTLYTVRRIFVILDWVKDVWINKSLSPHAQIKDVAWFWFGRGLALANLAYFSINMFGFLIPRFLPKAFNQYLREQQEMQTKTKNPSPSPDAPAAHSKKSI
ncbi:hypothetical protein QVD17_42244 [Tagetes erecta]|uniref:DUF7733 domain-containing protein n=1 Tax=Tagetes erecta TaxID=13708 RepID=A0AAD8JP36_TARER|nr:hypothetical protein QVD17_42244 [Tagetes erecta]